MYNRLDTIPACDRRTDGRISCHGVVRAMHTRRAVTIGFHSVCGATLFCIIDENEVIIILIIDIFLSRHGS